MSNETYKFRLRNWIQALGRMLWRDMMMLLIGAGFHFHLLHPAIAEENSPFFGPNGLLPIKYRNPILFLFLALLLFYLIPWLIRYWHVTGENKQEEKRTGHWLSWLQPTLMMNGAVAMLPVPVYLLIFPEYPCRSLVGILLCFWQTTLLARSSSATTAASYHSPQSIADTLTPDEIAPSKEESWVLIMALMIPLCLDWSFQRIGEIGPLLRYNALGTSLLSLLFSFVSECQFVWRKKRISAWRKRQGFPPLERNPLIYLFNAPISLLLTVGVFVILAKPAWHSIFLISLVIRQIYAFCWIQLEGRPHAFHPSKIVGSSSRLLLGGFPILILAGAFVLSLPCCCTSENPIPFLDALFLSTSSVCVTGLSTIEITTELSTTGYVIIAILFQIGGLGIMTISFFLAQFLSQNIGIQVSAAVTKMTGEQRGHEARYLLKLVVLGTLFFEIAGALIMAPSLHNSLHYSWMKSLCSALFLSISAFCSAGFSLFHNSIVPLQQCPAVLWTITLLIMLGGISFLVFATLIKKFREPHKPLFWGTYTKLVLYMTIPLWIIGFFGTFLLEHNHAFAPLSTGESMLASLFHAVSCRSAGFFTMPTTTFSHASKLLTLIMMFIGVAPGSTGGGIRVTSLGIMLLLFRAWLKGSQDVNFDRHRISHFILIQAGASTMLMLLLTIVGCFLLSVVMPNVPLFDLCFEATAASSTVGLSLGITEQLPTSGKWILMGLMFLGRIGPLTLLLSLSPQYKKQTTASNTNILIG